jgi:hypothetical protein
MNSKPIYKIDDNGFLLGQGMTSLDHNNNDKIGDFKKETKDYEPKIPLGYIDVSPPTDKFFRAKWNFEKRIWEEGEDFTVILNQRRNNKITDLKNKSQQVIFAGFYSQTTGYNYDFELKDQLNFNMQYSYLTNNPDILNIYWSTNDYGKVSHDRDTFFSVCKDAEVHKRSSIEKYWNLKKQIENAKTVEEIDLINW